MCELNLMKFYVSKIGVHLPIWSPQMEPDEQNPEIVPDETEEIANRFCFTKDVQQTLYLNIFEVLFLFSRSRVVHRGAIPIVHTREWRVGKATGLLTVHMDLTAGLVCIINCIVILRVYLQGIVLMRTANEFILDINCVLTNATVRCGWNQDWLVSHVQVVLLVDKGVTVVNCKEGNRVIDSLTSADCSGSATCRYDFMSIRLDCEVKVTLNWLVGSV